jgi:flagellar basal-body rod protein FlgC
MNLFGILSIGASGMAAQRTRAELLTENLANAETTRTPEGGPYRRKDAVFASTGVSSPFASVFNGEVQASGVTVDEIVTDTRDPELRYLPGHPDANAEGYVAFPRGNPAEDMVDGRIAGVSGQCGCHTGGKGYDRAVSGSIPLTKP